MFPPPFDSFRALGDPTRCRIIELLGDGPRSVSDLVDEFSVSQPAISRHLRVLREADLVESRRRGRKKIYALRGEALREIERWVEATSRAWAERLARLEPYVEEKSE